MNHILCLREREKCTQLVKSLRSNHYEGLIIKTSKGKSISMIFRVLLSKVKNTKIRFANIRFKVATADMRYFARSKFSKSLIQKKNFSLVWEVLNFSLRDKYSVKGGRMPVVSYTSSWQFCKQTITKLSLAYSFGKVCLICQNLTPVLVTYS